MFMYSILIACNFFNVTSHGKKNDLVSGFYYFFKNTNCSNVFTNFWEFVSYTSSVKIYTYFHGYFSLLLFSLN